MLIRNTMYILIFCLLATAAFFSLSDRDSATAGPCNPEVQDCI